MFQRLIRAAGRGDDWGCCPAKPVRLVQRENVTSVHYKNSQIANGNRDVRYSTARAPWSGEVRGRTANSSTDPVTAEAGLNAGGSSSGSCWVLVYAVAASSVVVAALIIALVAILLRRRRLHNGARGSNGAGGGGQWNKKLAGILTPPNRNLLRHQPKSAAPKPGFDDAKSPSAVHSATSAASSSKRPPIGNQRHGYTPLPGSVYPAAKTSTTQRRDPNPYGLPPSQCSYQPQRVKFVRVKRKRTIDSQTGDVDADDNDEELSPSRQYAEVDNEIPAINDLQALLPLTSLRSLFGVVGGVFGIAPSLGGAQQPITVVDRRASCVAAHGPVPGVDGPSASAASPAARLTGANINGAKAALFIPNSNVAPQPIDAGRDMGANASAEPPLSGSDLAGTAPPVESSPNDFKSFGSGGTLDNIQTTSMATLASSTAPQSVASSDLDTVPAGSDDSVSYSTQSQRQSIAEKWSVDDEVSTRRQSAQSTGSTTFDAAGRQTTTKLGRIGGLADALGLGDLMRSVTNSQQSETEKVEPFWVPPGLQIQKRRAQSLQSALPLSQIDASNANAKNGKVETCLPDK